MFILNRILVLNSKVKLAKKEKVDENPIPEIFVFKSNF